MRPRPRTVADIDLERDPVVIPSSAFYRVGEREFGVPGLIAVESVGPFVPAQAVGPFFMIHDSYWQPGFGIGHHPHRTNERLFYIVEGRVEHDDALNGIKGTMEEGDLGRLTEGLRGMLHQEWNGAPGRTSHAFILVYRPDTEPPPPVAEFAVLRAAERPVYEEGDGATTTELVGPRSPFGVNLSTMRFFADTTLRPGGEQSFHVAPNEGAILYPLEGSVMLAGAEAEMADAVELSAEGSTLPEGPREMAVVLGRDGRRDVRLSAPEGPARLIQIRFAARPGDIIVA